MLPQRRRPPMSELTAGTDLLEFLCSARDQVEHLLDCFDYNSVSCYVSSSRQLAGQLVQQLHNDAKQLSHFLHFLVRAILLFVWGVGCN